MHDINNCKYAIPVSTNPDHEWMGCALFSDTDHTCTLDYFYCDFHKDKKETDSAKHES